MFGYKSAWVACLWLSTLNCSNPGVLAGSGQVVGEEGNIANFGFNRANCGDDPGQPSWRFDYADKLAGAKLDGVLTDTGMCVRPEQWRGEWFELDCSLCADLVGVPSYVANFDYRSSNPAMPGEGEGLVCLHSGAEHGQPGEHGMFVWITSGPYADYRQRGPVQGELHQRSCAE